VVVAGTGQERAGAEHAALGMAQADQALGADHLRGVLERDLGLIPELEPAALERLGERDFLRRFRRRIALLVTRRREQASQCFQHGSTRAPTALPPDLAQICTCRLRCRVNAAPRAQAMLCRRLATCCDSDTNRS